MSGELQIDGVSTSQLAREYGTPLFVFSEARLRENIRRLQQVRSVINCPLKICYAAKAMSTMSILQVVRDAGIDIEVNSGGELWKALKAGFSGEQIIFNGTSKEAWELEMSIDAGIYAIQVDSLYELSLIEETADRLGKKANVSLRLVPEIESATHSGLQTALLSSKFGMMPDEALSAFARHSHSPHLNLCGIHLHIGSQNPDGDVYREALEKLFEMLFAIHTRTGQKVEHVNLGGGFPIDYIDETQRVSKGHSESVQPTAPDISDDQIALLSAHFDPSDAVAKAWSAVREIAEKRDAGHLLDNLTLLLEPGRSIVADAGICLTTVRNAKSRPAGRAGADTDSWLLTDAGFNILLSMETYKWYYHLVSADRFAEPHDTPYKLAGPLCDGGDVYFDLEGHRLPSHRLLPKDVRPGEVLALLNCGAYSLAQASQYNGRFLPAVVLIRESGGVELIRRRDRFEDLIGSDVF
jgi:D-ornithine/D-lysine decarboxylase